MKPLTPEEGVLLADLQKRQKDYTDAAQLAAENIHAMVTTFDEGDEAPDGAKLVLNIEKIRAILENFSVATVHIGEFMPQRFDGVRVVDVTTLHGAPPLSVPASTLKLAPWCEHENKTMVLRVEGGSAWRCDACLGVTDDPNVGASPVEGESLARPLRFFGEFEEPLRSDGIRRFFSRKKNLGPSYWFLFPLGDRSPYYDSEDGREKDIRGWRESL